MSAMSNLVRVSDDELARLGVRELIRRLRKCEADRVQQMVDHSNLMKDVNKRLQLHLSEIRGLKEVNTRLQDENGELRDLCCFLDDDRQKGKKIAKEWQRFGRYTSGVMRSEVLTYQEKLKELEDKQMEMLRDNLELKQLCLFLDQERNSGGSLTDERDEGDGSSSGTTQNSDDSDVPTNTTPATRPNITDQPANTEAPSRINEETLRYIRQLESHIQSLEQNQHTPTQQGPGRDAGDGAHRFFATPRLKGPPVHRFTGSDMVSPPVAWEPAGQSSPTQNPPSKPHAVAQAMKVLEVKDELEHSQITNGTQLGETERAILKEMCNVVWRRLEAEPKTAVSSNIHDGAHL